MVKIKMTHGDNTAEMEGQAIAVFAVNTTIEGVTIKDGEEARGIAVLGEGNIIDILRTIASSLGTLVLGVIADKSERVILSELMCLEFKQKAMGEGEETRIICEEFQIKTKQRNEEEK